VTLVQENTAAFQAQPPASVLPVTAGNGRRIANLSFVCAVLIACIHVPNPDCISTFFTRWFPGGLVALGVPFFFVVSGYLFLNHLDRLHWWRDALAKRLRTVLVPFLLINLVWFAVYYGVHNIAVARFGSHQPDCMRLTWRNFFFSVNPLPNFRVMEPALGPTWYLKALLLLALCAPLYLWFIRRSRLCAAAFLAAVAAAWYAYAAWMFASPPVGEFPCYELEPRCLFYFAAGMSLRLWPLPRLSIPAALASATVGFVLLVLCALRIPPSPMHRSLLSSLAVPFLLAALWTATPSSPWPRWLVANTFPLYILHFMLFYLAPAVCKALHLPAAPATAFGQALCVLAVVPVSCLLAAAFKKAVPRTASLFFGGR
jgi:peptidoglycan/LPS O-acetylase OafA/YrhL